MLVAQLKKSDIKSVAVVVSPDVSQLKAIQNAGFDYIQIHGELSDDVYNACSVRIIRAVNIKHQSEEDIYLETKRWRSLDKIYGLLLMREFRGAVRHSTGKVLKSGLR